MHRNSGLSPRLKPDLAKHSTEKVSSSEQPICGLKQSYPADLHTSDHRHKSLLLHAIEIVCLFVT